MAAVQLLLVRIWHISPANYVVDFRTHNSSRLRIGGFEGEAGIESLPAKVLQRFAFAEIQRGVQGFILEVK